MGERLVASDHEQKRQKQLCIELEQRLKDRGLPRRVHVIAGVVVNQLPEQAAIDLLSYEALDLADAADRLGQRRRDPAEALRLRAIGLTQALRKWINTVQRMGAMTRTTSNNCQS